MTSTLNKVLVIAPHADDGELGCGGTIAKLIEQNKEVYYATFSFAEESVPKEFPKNILETEVKKSTKELGISSDNLVFHRYKVRYFTYHRQEILEDLVKLRKSIQPDLVLIPNMQDIHQDHQVISTEGIRAFKNVTVWGYELPWNNLTFKGNNYVKLTRGHLETKISAINCYDSQKHRKYINDEFIYSLARVRGTQVANEFAECFEVIRQVS